MLISTDGQRPGRRRRGLAVVAALLLGGCASPAERYDREADALGLARHLVVGAGFTHAVFERHRRAASGRLHVYLEGDGTPLLRGVASPDPTPRRPLALALLARDPAPALLLGRPCHHGLAGEAACAPEHWTDARYGESVVASLAAALGEILAREGDPELVLIGHSGGGTLAMLLAPRLPQTRAVVTIAANLDLAAFAAHHRYRPLAGSLDPVLRPPPAAHVAQRHLAGGRDRVVPPALIAAALRRLGAAPAEVVPGFDHRCCWRDLWPAPLAGLP